MKWMNIRLSAIATAFLFLWMRIQGASLITSTSPRGIVDLELAETPTRVNELISVWNKTIVINNILIDFLFIPAYALFLSLICLQLAKRFKVQFLSNAGLLIARGIWLAAILDLVENSLMLVSMNGMNSIYICQLTRWVALVKFCWVGLAILYLIVYLLPALFHFTFKKKSNGE
ncbi:MAG: hypothetical protein ACKO1T_06285 [Sediminibacterium sp.]